MAGRRLIIALLALGLTTGAKKADMDPVNPTCPKLLNWSTNRQMVLTPKTIDGQKVLLAEGAIDNGLMPRLAQALNANPDVAEIWVRSPGGVASVGNEAGRLIRKKYPNVVTRIPAGWACFSACNFFFMGGTLRIVEPGGLYIVHMFTHIGNRDELKEDIKADADGTVDLIGEIEQDSAMLASDDNDFLIRMGVSRKLLTEVMYKQKALATSTDKSTRRCLTQDQLVKYNVSNAQ